MLKATTMIVSAVFIFQGCSSILEKQQNAANVTSTPSAAIVYADGRKLGVTPLSYDLYKAFPAGWSNWEYSARGVLTVKKQGCEDYALTINDRILSKPIHANLKCTGVATDSKVVPAVDSKKEKPLAAPVTKPATKPATKPVSDIERRLSELEALHKKGVINDDEYTAIRKRILGEL